MSGAAACGRHVFLVRSSLQYLLATALAADRGGAPSVELEPAASPPPPGSVPTGQPALPDRWRQQWPAVTFGAVLILLAVVLLVVFRRSGAARHHPDQPVEPVEPVEQPPPGPHSDVRLTQPGRPDPPSEGAS